MRILGRPDRPIVGPRPPTPEEVQASRDAAKGRRFAPKGVFRYRTHEEANRDAERWLIDEMARKAAWPPTRE